MGTPYPAVFARAVRDVSGQIISPGNVPTVLVFDLESYDTAGYYDDTTGVYTNGGPDALHLITAHISIENTAGGTDRIVSIRIDGTPVATVQNPVYGGAAVVEPFAISTLQNVANGSTIDVVAYSSDANDFLVSSPDGTGDRSYLEIRTVFDAV